MKNLKTCVFVALLWALFASLNPAFGTEENGKTELRSPVTDNVRAAFTVEKGGRHYLVTELIEHKREPISPWNALRLRRGDEYWKYQVYDSTNTVRLYKPDYERNRELLRYVPEVGAEVPDIEYVL